ncbi:MAG: VWA domain-containing protein [Myxococcota bacterium]|nr:VWA domain-containing protein [Myxococcota bacterium]
MNLPAGLEFREPVWLLLIFLVPLVYAFARRSQGYILYSSLTSVKKVSPSLRQRFSWIPAALFSISTLGMVVAAAGPRIGDRNTEVKKDGIAIMMIMDTSGSMKALDLSEKEAEDDRLSVVKKLFEQFVLGSASVSGRSNDTIGIIRFAGYADTACPLTLDHGSLVGVARTLQIVEDRSEDGTAIGDALALAVGRIKESPARSKIAILLTDGVNNKGEETPLAAAELAKTEGVKVYAIGAGTNGMAPIRMRDPFTGQEVLQAVPVQIDEDMLKEIAARTNGRYFRATDYKSLQQIYGEIDRLEKTELSQMMYRQYTEYYFHLLLIALSLLSLGFITDATIFRRSP